MTKSNKIQDNKPKLPKGFLSLKSRKVIDVREVLTDPREISYHLKPKLKALINLPTLKGRLGMFYELEKSRSLHPYLLAASTYIEKRSQKDSFDLIKKYSELFTINNANENLGLEEYPVFPDSSSPFGYILPWEAGDPVKKIKARLEQMKKENLRYGLSQISHLGSSNCCDRKILIETKRITELAESIMTSGYKLTYKSPISANILIHDREYTWMPSSGNHRVAILSALGWNLLPVLINGFIRREEVSLWPAVRTGLYTEESALCVFDRIFQANPPASAKKWVEQAKQTYCAT